MFSHKWGFVFYFYGAIPTSAEILLIFEKCFPTSAKAYFIFYIPFRTYAKTFFEYDLLFHKPKDIFRLLRDILRMIILQFADRTETPRNPAGIDAGIDCRLHIHV